MPDFSVRTAFTAVDGMTNTFARMSKGASRFGGILSGVLPMLSGVAVMAFAEKSIQAFKDSEAAIANVEAGLKSTNNAIGITADKFSEMAAAIQSVGIFEDDAILQNVTAQLLTFGNIGAQNFDRVQRAVTDVTAKLKGINATGEDLRSTSLMMGKAMEDPIKGLTAMRRIGISFSASEEGVIKSMVRANDMLGAQNYMLSVIERQYGGTNEALGKTSAGMEILARNQLGDMMENLGKELIPVKIQLIKMATEILPKINDILPIVGDLLPFIIAGFVGWKTAMIALAAVHATQEIIGFYKYFKTDAIPIIQNVIKSIKTWRSSQIALNIAIKANPIGLIIGGAMIMIGLITTIIKKWDTWGSVLLLFVGVFALIIAPIMAIKMHWFAIVDAFKRGDIIGGLKEIGMMLLDMVLYPLQKILELIGKIPGIGKFATQAATAIQGFREGSKESPNKAEVEGKYSSRTDVNIYSNGTEARADVRGNGVAKINMARPIGVNP